MTTLARVLGALLALLVLGAASPASQDSGSPAPRKPIERLRERLRDRPEEERARLERHLAEFERLPPDARMRVLQRARILRERERELERDAARASERPAPSEEPPERARERRRAHLHERFRERGRALRERMPPELRHELEQAPPEKRRRCSDRLGAKRDYLSLHALARIGAHLQLDPDEIRRIQQLPLDERLEALRALRDRTVHGG